MRRLCLLVLLLIVFPLTSHAQDAASTYPTLSALEAVVIPARDQSALAQRLLGVETIPAPPQSAPPLAVGMQETFWATNSFEDRSFEVEATLVVLGEHIALWMDDGAADYNVANLQAIADAFDTDIYDPVRSLFGSEPNPGVDGDPRVHGLFAYGLGPGVAAYFSRRHNYPTEVVPTSNAREMLFYNMDTIGNALGNTDILVSITAHEFQHMIRSNVDSNEYGWMDEGFSTFTQSFVGLPDTGSAVSFLNSPGTQLNTWNEGPNRAPDYGASLLWTTYLYDRFGVKGMQAISNETANGFVGIERALGDTNVLFADWVMANFLNDVSLGDGVYGYTDLTFLPSPRHTEVNAYPYAETRMSNQYATQYFVLKGLDGLSEITIDVTAPVETQLAPTTPLDGQWVWYSHRGDDSDMRLTRAFDLTSVTSATLEYDLWFHTENLWDYGYVMVSTDGTTWTPLATPHTTTDDPHFNAYGPGYTGRSGGNEEQSIWVRESISLDTYTGQPVFVRFEIIYDDAINQPGMLIDNVAIPEIGYFGDFETDGGGFEAEGWVRTDNRLPQQVWVQTARRFGQETELQRWSLADGRGTYTIDLGPGADDVVLAISPYAPVTTVPAELTISVDAR